MTQQLPQEKHNAPYVDDEPSDADVVGDWQDCRSLQLVRFQAVIATTGTPVGVLKVQTTEDPNTASDNTVAVTSANVITYTIPDDAVHGDGVAVSGANSTLLNLLHIGGWIRFWYDSTSAGSDAGGVTVHRGGRGNN